MQKSISFLAFIAITIIVSSCGKSNKEGLLVPENAAMVILMDGESMNEKLPWQEVKENELFKLGMQDTSMATYMRSALENPENTGVNIKKDFILYIVKDSAGSFGVLQGTVADEGKFRTYNTSVAQGTSVAQKDGISTISKDMMLTAWNKDRFMIFMNLPDVNMNELSKENFENDSLPSDSSILNKLKFSQRDLATLVPTHFNLKKENSLAGNDKFTDLVDDDGDILFYVNLEETYSDMPGMEQLAMMDLAKVYRGSFVTGSADFENGKIEIETRSYAGKELEAIWKKYESSGFSTDMAERVNTDNIAVFFTFNFKPQGLLEFIKLIGMEGMINMGTAFLGFTLDDFVKGNKGNVLFTVSNMRTDSSGKSEADVLFAAEINDKTSFDKLINAGKKAGSEGLGSQNIHYSATDKYFAIGNNQNAVSTFTSGKGGKAPQFLSNMKGEPFVGYVNFQYIFKNIPVSETDSANRAMYDATVAMWESMTMKGGNFEDGGIEQEIEITLMDKNTNSLKQLNNYISKMAATQKNKVKINTSSSADTTTVTVL